MGQTLQSRASACVQSNQTRRWCLSASRTNVAKGTNAKSFSQSLDDKCMCMQSKTISFNWANAQFPLTIGRFALAVCVCVCDTRGRRELCRLCRAEPFAATFYQTDEVNLLEQWVIPSILIHGERYFLFVLIFHSLAMALFSLSLSPSLFSLFRCSSTLLYNSIALFPPVTLCEK